MDNAAKALQIAGAVLLAVIILSFIVYSFKQFGKMPEAEDKQMTAEQLAKFNQEFEVYKKSKMYGVDVISCLNKVQNYNDKYVLNVNDGQQTSGGFYSGTGKYGNEFKMDVRVAIGNPLSEMIEIRKRTVSGKEVNIGTDDVTDDSSKLESLGFKIESNEYTRLLPTMSVKELFANIDTINSTPIDASGAFKVLPSNDDMNNPKYCSLLYGDVNDSNVLLKMDLGSYEPNNALVQLLKYSDKYMRQIITNRKDNLTEWSSMTWETALYDFKKRRFTCEDMHYNDETGQIDIIIFKEVK